MAALQGFSNLVPLLAHNLGFAEASMRLLLTPLMGKYVINNISPLAGSQTS